VAIDPGERFADVVELLRRLEGGAAVERVALRPVPLMQRNPVRFWQVVSALLLLALICSHLQH
jgi:hypothetical protein